MVFCFISYLREAKKNLGVWGFSYCSWFGFVGFL